MEEATKQCAGISIGGSSASGGDTSSLSSAKSNAFKSVTSLTGVKSLTSKGFSKFLGNGFLGGGDD